MKKYINRTTNEWYYEGQILTKATAHSVFSGIPTVEQLIEFGFEEYVEPTPSAEELLNKAKENKILDIINYDKSSDVNSFTIGGQEMWLDFSLRQQLRTSIQAYKDQNIENVTKWFNGVSYTFSTEVWLSMLNTLEIYAAEALNVTEQHKANVNNLTTVTEIENYNYQTGYPTKLTF